MDPSISPTSPDFPGGIDIAPKPATENLDQFDDAELREIYETEEIERFLRLFSTYVTEVKAPNIAEKRTGQEAFERESHPTGEGDTGANDLPEEPSHYESISEEIAYRFVLPVLPPSRNPPPEFTLNRFKLASERVYLAIVPHYFPFLVRLYRLAKWRDKDKSSIYCAGFWVLWWLNLLPAAFFCNLIFILLKRRFLPYPSRSQLRKHREEISHADKFSEQLSHRLSSPSALGVKDIWRFGRVLMLPPKEKKRIVKIKAYPQVQAYLNGEDTSEPTILEDTHEPDEIQEMKRLGLFLMNETADFHERVKNVFIWRKPSSSWLYFGLCVLLFLGSLLVPARVVVKAMFGTGGFVFWHVVPVILALSPEERLRLPPPMLNVPTDADYAMELISQRVAAGLEIEPSKVAKRKRTSLEPSSVDIPTTPTTSVVSDHVDANLQRSRVMPGHVRGMEKAINSGKYLLQGGKEFIKTQTGQPTDDTPSFRSFVNPSPTTYTYPAQHSSAPGLITLTPTTLYFSPMTSSRSRLTIPLADIRGVKKVGVLKGLEIIWAAPGIDGHKIDKLEKFRWINNRDELFARVISSSSGKKWMNVQ